MSFWQRHKALLFISFTSYLPFISHALFKTSKLAGFVKMNCIIQHISSGRWICRRRWRGARAYPVPSSLNKHRFPVTSSQIPAFFLLSTLLFFAAFIELFLRPSHNKAVSSGPFAELILLSLISKSATLTFFCTPTRRTSQVSFNKLEEEHFFFVIRGDCSFLNTAVGSAAVPSAIVRLYT